MAVNYPRLAVRTSLILVEIAIGEVNKQIIANPAPATKTHLLDELTALTNLQNDLTTRLDYLITGTYSVPGLDATALDHIEGLIAQVEQAKNAGLSATQTLAVADQALSIGLAVLSF